MNELEEKLTKIEEKLGGSKTAPENVDKLGWHLDYIESLIGGGSGEGSGTQLVRITIMSMFSAPYYFTYDKGTLEEGLAEFSKDVGTEVTIDNMDEIFAAGNVYAKCMFWEMLHLMPISFSYDGIPVLRSGINNDNLAYIVMAEVVHGEELHADFKIQLCDADFADNWSLTVTPLYK